MKVFVLGGTGSIGSAIVHELLKRSHSVTALSRSAQSDAKLKELGVRVIRGDLLKPGKWVEEAVAHEAIIHAAATFDANMALADERVTSAIIKAAVKAGAALRLLYTGGCWLYGETGEVTATEAHPFHPIKAFAWMVRNGNRLLNAHGLSTAIVHPAMVYHEEGGAFERFLNAVQDRRAIEIWGVPETRWPLIERTDLARAYCDLLVRPELTGHYNAVAEEGVRVGDIANTFLAQFDCPPELIIRDVDDLVEQHGDWAEGPTLDQKMSSQKLRQATGWRPLIMDYRNSAILNP